VVPLLALAVVALPLLEVAVVSQLLVWAPWPLVLALIVVGSLTGLVVLRDGGIDDLRRWRRASRRRLVPEPDVVAGGLRDVSGLLLAIPGVVSTAAGLILLTPPLRRWMGGRVTAFGRARRERSVPPHEEKALLALPVPRQREMAELGPGSEMWPAAALPLEGHIAGAEDGARRDATESAFFGGGEDGEPLSRDAGPAAATAMPPRPPAPPQFPPGTFVQPSSAVRGRWALATAQSAANRTPGILAPVPPVPPTEAAPWEPGDDQSRPTAGASGWDAFVSDRNWEDEPGRGGRRRRKRKHQST